MAKKTEIDPQDLAAFYEAMQGTRPLKHKTRVERKPSPSLTNKTRDYKEAIIFKETKELLPVDGESLLSYKHNSIDNKILRNLRKGQYNVDANLDLHGMSVEKAENALNNFLQQSLDKGFRVVLIIHGKGRHNGVPLLKNKLNYWLRELNFVLAFCSATPHHGSGGALYVLLKRVTEE